MATSRKKQDEKNLKTLRELGSLPQNKYCFDCNQRGPTYVNVTIGSFVCTKCSGMLRGLTPPHRVKSISMATFTTEEVDLLKNRGNDYCKSVWLGLYEGDKLPSNDEQSIRDFMVEKYERKRFYLDPSQAMLSKKNGYAKPIQVKPLNGLITDAKPIKILNGNTKETNRKRPEVTKSAGFTVDFNNADIFASNNIIHNSNNNNNNNNSTGGKLESFANFDNNPAFDNNPGIPTSCSAFDGFNLVQTTNTTTTNNMSSAFPVQTQAPLEDKYAALKDLDNELKSQNAGADWNSSGSNGSLYSSPTSSGSMYSSPSPQNSMFGSPSQGQFMSTFPAPNQEVPSTFSNPFNSNNGMNNWGTNMNNFKNGHHPPIPNPFRSDQNIKINGFGTTQTFQPAIYPMSTNAWGMNPFKVEAGANINSNNPFL